MFLVYFMHNFQSLLGSIPQCWSVTKPPLCGYPCGLTLMIWMGSYYVVESLVMRWVG